MQVGNTNSVSFKGHFIVQGKPEALIEVAEDMQTKRKLPGSKLDFMAVRLMGYQPQNIRELPTIKGAMRLLGLLPKKKEEEPIDPVIYQAAAGLAKGKPNEAQLRAMSKDAVLVGDNSSKQGLVDMTPVNPAIIGMLGLAQQETDGYDLFVTGPHKDTFDLRRAALIRDSLEVSSDMPKRFANALGEADKNIVAGKPILGLKLEAIQEHLAPTDLNDVNVLQADDVLDAMKRGAFDFEEGAFK